jgi:hypothetical protein
MSILLDLKLNRRGVFHKNRYIKEGQRLDHHERQSHRTINHCKAPRRKLRPGVTLEETLQLAIKRAT